MPNRIISSFLVGAALISTVGCGINNAGLSSDASRSNFSAASSDQSIEEASSLTDDEIRALAFGAVLTYRNTMDYASLVGTSPNIVKLIIGGMENSWGITDRESAIEKLDWLKTEGHHLHNFDDAYNIYMGREETNDELNEYFKAELNACPGVTKTLKEDFRYTDEELAGITTISAWDYDRLVSVARWCYAAEYITEEEAWGYINFAAEQGTNDYDSWRSYFAGVMYGRTMWAENETLSPEDKEIATVLLYDNSSIYNTVSFSG